MQFFTEQIIRVISRIPAGKVLTYGAVAAMAGNNRGARQVSRVLHSMSGKYGLPWHRVIGAKGKISLPAGEGREEQLFLLEREGVRAGENGTICLEKFLWNGGDG